MEPTLNNLPKNIDFPAEPTLNPSRAQQAKKVAPKIVPADLIQPFKVPESAPKTVPVKETVKPVEVQKTETEQPKDPKALMAKLSKDIEELSQPAGSQMPPIGQKGPDGIRYPEEDDLGDPEDPPSSGGFFRSFMLLLCLLFIIVASWQVCLFLQPEFLKEEPLNQISQKSCDYLYCPPLRTPSILSSQINATGDNLWDLTLTIQNQDMRAQKLPILQLDLVNARNQKTQLIFEPKEYTVAPATKEIQGGQTVNINVPFGYENGRPTSFKLKVVEN